MSPIKPPLATAPQPPKKPSIKPNGSAPTEQKVAPVWAKEIDKFQNAEVVVRYVIGEQEFKVEGRMRHFNIYQQFCVVDTDTEAIYIRVPSEIRRVRKSANAKPNS